MMEGPTFLRPMRGGFRNHNKLPTQYLDQVPLQQSNIVTEHGVTEQRCYYDPDPDFVCTITWLAAHYFSSLRCCMVAALV